MSGEIIIAGVCLAGAIAGLFLIADDIRDVMQDTHGDIVELPAAARKAGGGAASNGSGQGFARHSHHDAEGL